MALRVLRPKSPHSEEIAQYIEWRDPCGHAAVWLQGSAVQGRHDRLIGKCWKVDTYSKREVMITNASRWSDFFCYFFLRAECCAEE